MGYIYLCMRENVQNTDFHFLMQGLSEDKQFIGESLLSRLQDDDPAVVASVLKLGEVPSRLIF